MTSRSFRLLSALLLAAIPVTARAQSQPAANASAVV